MFNFRPALDAVGPNPKTPAHDNFVICANWNTLGGESKIALRRCTADTRGLSFSDQEVNIGRQQTQQFMLFTSVAKKAYNITSKSICCLSHPFPDEKIPKYCCIGNYGLMIAEVVAVVAAEEASVIEEIAQTASIHVIEEEAEVATVGETGD